MYGWEEKKEYAVFVLIAAILLWMFSFLPIAAEVERKCLQYGYPEYRVSWNYEKYCVRTIEQTQYTVPLEDVLGK